MSKIQKSRSVLADMEKNRRTNGQFGERKADEATGVDLATPQTSTRLSIAANGTLAGPRLKVTKTKLSIGDEKPISFSLSTTTPYRVGRIIDQALETGEVQDIENHPAWLFAMPDEEEEDTLVLHVSTSRRQERTTLTMEEAAQLAEHLKSM